MWSNLAACGWPGPSNTGYQLSACPNGLTENVGSTSRMIRVTTPNTRIECQNIVGCLTIEAPNVTVSNVKIACTSGRTGEAANGTAVIFIDDGASATIDRVEINGMSGVHSCIWHQGTSMTARAVNCYKVNDGIFSWANRSYSQTTGDNFTITDSYFHDFTTKTANGHADGYQTEGAGNGLIRHNTYLMTSDAQNDSNSAIAIWNSLRSSHDIMVQSNLIAGGGFSIYAEDYSPSESSPAGGYTVTDISFSDNVFSNHLFGCVGYYGVWFPRGRPTDGWQRQGNVLLETGANLDSSNPTLPGTRLQLIKFGRKSTATSCHKLISRAPLRQPEVDQRRQTPWVSKTTLPSSRLRDSALNLSCSTSITTTSASAMASAARCSRTLFMAASSAGSSTT